ncbi:MAG TPA: hypothetical protein DDY70_06535 [Clostridiales bacterium]|nr:hypothetical protein [Clostridiales bacterium]
MLIADEISPDEQVKAVKDLADAFSETMTMSAYTAWKVESGSADATLRSEYARLSEVRPRLIQSIETLCVAAANSPHREILAAECFTEELSPYLDGGQYTDEAVDAMIREVKKENEYRFLSEANITVTYGDETDTAAALIARYRERYGEDSKEFLAAKAGISSLYQTAKTAREKELYTELVALRRETADELGATSYTEVAYGELSYSYTQKEMETLLSDVAKDAVQVYRRLYNDIFISRGDSVAPSQKIYKTINRLSSIYGEKGGILSEAYNFMLQYSLFDIAPTEDGRATGSRVFYLDAYDSPLLSLTAKEKVTDYLSLSYAFGGYLAAYRFGNVQSAELSAFHAAACELMTLRLMKEQVTDDTYTTLLYSAMQNILLDLINNAFATAVETRVYALPKDGITAEAIDAIVAETAAEFGLSEGINSISYVLCDELVVAPLSLQAHVTSVLPALELFFDESETPSLGVETYLSLLSEDSAATTLSAVLSAAKLESPFAPERVKKSVCNIFYELYGANYNDAKSAGYCNAA